MSDHDTTATKRVDSICNSGPQPCGCVHDTLCPRNSRLWELESELKKIRQESRGTLVAHNQKYDPLSGMPSEFMSLIFHFAIDYQHHKPDGIAMFCMESARVYIRPIWLASVCTRWRRIALADPTLWSLINIVYRPEIAALGRKRWTPSLELVQRWLSRSGVLPLRIKLVWCNASESEDETLRRIIEALCAQCHRWRSLYIRVPPEAMSYFQCAVSEHTIDLDHLCIDHDDAVCHPLTKMGFTTLRPRHVALHRPPWAAQAFLWTNMVSLRISDVSPSQSLNIIVHTSRLEELNLNFLDRPRVHGDVSALTEPITASRLGKMRVAFTANEDLEEFFMFIRAPELESLDLVRFTDEGIHVPLGFLEPLLLQSGNRLRSLSLRSITFPTEDLLNLLSGLHELSYLKMDFGSEEAMALAPRLDGLFGRLLETSTENPFLPRLSHLIYSGSRTFMWSSFADVLCAHATVDNPSKRLLQILGINLVPSLVPENYVDKETLNRLLALQRSKMTVRVYIDELLIQASFEHHGILGAPFPLLFRTWNTYNLTPSFSHSF